MFLRLLGVLGYLTGTGLIGRCTWPREENPLAKLSRAVTGAVIDAAHTEQLVLSPGLPATVFAAVQDGSFPLQSLRSELL